LMLIAGDADPLNPLNGGPAKNPCGQPYTKSPMIDSVTNWLTFNDESTTDFTTESGDGFTTKTYAGKTKCLVIFTVITNQGHEWPGHHRVLPRAITGNNSATFDAAAVIWDFFKSKSLDN
jgi:poly(3-hydroxybutyrate) depolymerase